MSHEIETMAWSNEVPWHGLGVRVSDDISVDEMLIQAGLNWKLEKQKLFMEVADEKVYVPGKRALMRSSDRKIMGIAGQDWAPVQNSDVLGFFRDYAEAGGAKLETAGSLKGGSMVWGLANLNDSFTVGSNDHVKGYLLFMSSHTPGVSTKVKLTSVRVVCANTMAMALAGASDYSQSHLKEFDFSAAKAVVEKAHEGLREAGARAKTLHDLKLSMADSLKFLGQFFDVPQDTSVGDIVTIANSGDNKKFSEVVHSLIKAPGAELGTGWGVLNAVTHWADHVSGRDNATRMFRSWVGDGGALKNKVEKELLELC